MRRVSPRILLLQDMPIWGLERPCTDL